MTANKLEGKARELEQKWRESAAKLDRGFGPGDSILAAGKRQCADELAAVLNALDTARQPDTIHTCSYYCDRPECVKAQRDQLREAYVARQSEGMVLVPLAALQEVLRISDREHDAWREVKEAIAAAPADAGEGNGNG